MDATDDNKDVKLYRASGDLLPEIRAKLPKLVRYSQPEKHGQIRKWVVWSKTDEIIQRLDRFQEWPQLLDPHLASFIQVLADAYVSYVINSSDNYVRKSSAPAFGVYTVPLPRAISRLLYVFCKVRGQKIIVRLLNNEPKYIEPLLSFMAHWNKPLRADIAPGQSGMVWEERYILLLWLSHLLLTPFDLSSVSSLRIVPRKDVVEFLTEGLPNIAASLFSVSFENLFVASKEREAASALLVRLALRADMQGQHLLKKVINYAIRTLERNEVNHSITAYHHVGLLSLLSGILTSGSDEDVAPFVQTIFAACHRLATGDHQHELSVRATAPARKLLIKTMRSALLHAIYLNSKRSKYVMTDELDCMLEDAIQYLLEALSDKDTPVRMAASKNLALVVLKLDDSMSAEVVQAVLDSLNENILLEDLESGALLGLSDVLASQAVRYRRNTHAVDPLKWQGLMLNLGHLLFRRSPPPQQLPAIIEALVSGLHFEQRSNVGTSLGVGVRDAACFGVWSLARKYSTQEVLLVEVGDIQNSAAQMIPPPPQNSVLQIVATELVVSACTDPSGNIRRGSSAALQELIGRHPDTIIQGIPLVQIVDYHAVARRSHAMCQVAIQAATLAPEYHTSLLNALMDWRGAKAADPDSRRSAASALGDLVKNISQGQMAIICKAIFNRICKLRPSNMGLPAEIRHGFLLTLSSMIRTAHLLTTNENQSYEISVQSRNTELEHEVVNIWKSLDQLTGDLNGRITSSLELVLEASSSLITSLATFEGQIATGQGTLSNTFVITERCITASEKDHVIDAASKAAVALFRILDREARSTLIQNWMTSKDRKKLEYKSKGRVVTIGLLFNLLPADGPDEDMKSSMLSFLKDLSTDSWPVETRVNAMTSLAGIISSMQMTPESIKDFAPVIVAGLTDYTIDQRGDVGSTLRFQSIDTVEQILASTVPTSEVGDTRKLLVQEVVKLAAEKLSKVRLRAWTCLVRYWKTDNTFPPLPHGVSHIADVSSPAYYRSLLEILHVDWLRRHLILGLVSSAAGGTEDIGRASCEALVTYLSGLHDADRDLISQEMLTILLGYLSTCAITDDRNIMPTMEFLAFLLEQGLLSADLPAGRGITADIWTVIDRIHVPTASIQRLEIIAKLYSALCVSEQQRTPAIDRLTRLLLHRYPKIRGGAADTLFLHTGAEKLISCDWNLPVGQLKPIVLQLREMLRVATPTFAKSSTAGFPATASLIQS